MTERTYKKRVFGWMMYDWATQPYHTLIITFFFAPYFAEQLRALYMAEGMDAAKAAAEAQAFWGYVVAFAGILIALSAPVLGAFADARARRMPYIWGFSALYVIGSAGLWFAAPAQFDPYLIALFFILGVIGLELTTVFTNAFLPSLGSREEVGRISGNGWALGYVGGLIALILMLTLFIDNAEGKTFLGNAPLLGLNGEAREGTRLVGPFSALWYALFMIPFFLWVKDVAPAKQSAAITPIRDLLKTLKTLPAHPSLMAYLGSSMFYRDALNGVFTFGGIYAVGTLCWETQDMGVFGIIGIISGTVFAYLGGKFDMRFGPKPVIRTCLWTLLGVCCVILSIGKDQVLFIPVAEDSGLPSVAFYICGAIIGALGGTLQAASRTMMVRQADPDRMTEAFGLYALSGKATAFLAPLLIAIMTDVTGSQVLGITPLILLIAIALYLFKWVTPEGYKNA